MAFNTNLDLTMKFLFVFVLIFGEDVKVYRPKKDSYTARFRKASE